MDAFPARVTFFDRVWFLIKILGYWVLGLADGDFDGKL